MKKLSKFAVILLAVAFVLFSMTGCPEPTVGVTTGTTDTRRTVIRQAIPTAMATLFYRVLKTAKNTLR